MKYVKALNISSVWTDQPSHKAEINVTTARAAASLHVLCHYLSPSKMGAGLRWHKDSEEQFSAALRRGEIVLYFSRVDGNTAYHL